MLVLAMVSVHMLAWTRWTIINNLLIHLSRDDSCRLIVMLLRTLGWRFWSLSRPLFICRCQLSLVDFALMVIPVMLLSL